MFAQMERALEQHAGELAAVIVEPLVQCAGQMRMYHPVYLTLLRDACDRYGVHLIADEIAVGFGRTGTMFACEQAHITPDFLCLSKGITGGFLPLSVVLTRDAIYQAFYAEYREQRAFLHSHSYTGNALACAAARATLDIFGRMPVLERNRALAARMAQHAAALNDHPNVADVRQCGTILAVEFVQQKANRQPFASNERRGVKLMHAALEGGVLLRPIGNVVYCMPPYVLRNEECDLMMETLAAALDHACSD
jgi:adenosylmethionine-8-amino-7-oxononanoate aminotransferase